MPVAETGDMALGPAQTQTVPRVLCRQHALYRLDFTSAAEVYHLGEEEGRLGDPLVPSLDPSGNLSGSSTGPSQPSLSEGSDSPPSNLVQVLLTPLSSPPPLGPVEVREESPELMDLSDVVLNPFPVGAFNEYVPFSVFRNWVNVD